MSDLSLLLPLFDTKGRPVPRRIKDTITALAFSFLLALGASTFVGKGDYTELKEIKVDLSRAQYSTIQ